MFIDRDTGASRVTIEADAWIPQSPVRPRSAERLETAMAMTKTMKNNAAHL
jgi:hypothetical protein